ncbi:unnamed protein product, partial [Brassica oleracea var. botrytis]
TSEFLTIFGKYLGKAYLISLRYTTLVKYYYVYFAIQRFLQEKNMSLINGTNSIPLLSGMVGLPVKLVSSILHYNFFSSCSLTLAQNHYGGWAAWRASK